MNTDYIVEVNSIGGYCLNVLFNTGEIIRLDLSRFIHESNDPTINSYRQLDRFNSFRVTRDGIVWGDFDFVVAKEIILNKKEIKPRILFQL